MAGFGMGFLTYSCFYTLSMAWKIQIWVVRVCSKYFPCLTKVAFKLVDGENVENIAILRVFYGKFHKIS